MSRPGPMPTALIDQRADRMAALLADGASVAEAGALMGLSKGETASTWRRIKTGLGAQAR